MSALVAAAASRWVFLADDTDVGDETHKGGPIAIVVIIVLCVACFFLFRSMSRHLKNVRTEFPDPDATQDTTPTDAGGRVTTPAPPAGGGPQGEPPPGTPPPD